VKKATKKSGQTEERNIDMAEHGYRVKALGLSDRAIKKMIRIAVLLVPVALIVFWFIKAVK
jgi:hypothetical protein